MGFNPNDLPASKLINYGIVNIDKPRGPTSHQVSDYVQRILEINKAGHSGTLDPHVTGVLPIALGKATRIVQFLLKAGKEYVCLMHIHKEIGEKKIREIFSEFIGAIKQKPPLKSAVKRVQRTRHIYYLEILEIDGQDILFKVGCEAGTYIRKLCHDIGKKLESGAHMQELRRTKVASFDESTLVTLQDLMDAFHYYKNENKSKFIKNIIQPIENGVKHLAKIYVLDSTVESLCHGSDLKIPGISKLDDTIAPDDLVAVMSLKNELVAVGRARLSSLEIMNSEKGIAVKIEKVFMQPGVYQSTVKRVLS
jgi:H/ACA ribonucleoprotein complex subunit 4